MTGPEIKKKSLVLLVEFAETELSITQYYKYKYTPIGNPSEGLLGESKYYYLQCDGVFFSLERELD